MSILLTLYYEFFKIGLFAVGGGDQLHFHDAGGPVLY